MVSQTIPVEPFDLVVFGATGDLARRKLFPALYRRMLAGQIPETSRIVGAARSPMDDAAFRNFAGVALAAFVPAEERKPEMLAAFVECLHYCQIDIEGEGGWQEMAELLKSAEDERARAFYLSIAPRLFAPVCAKIAAAGLGGEGTRIVVEKPFGHDVETAKALNRQLSENFAEQQLYRIDHYLGKETVQNLMAIRFANALFEPLWNARHVDHVQITVAETLGVEGRASYYDRNGALRDMMQNHLMQLLCLTAMEPPSAFEPDAVRDEKLKVIRALDPIGPDRVSSDTVRGQYRAFANGDGKSGRSYLEDVDNPASLTESYVALKVHIANWRWAGTPFYLRTGKRLRAQLSEIAVIFKDAPHWIFPPKLGDFRGNALIVRLQPDEGITLRMTIKEPGPGGMRLTEVPLDMTFAKALGSSGLQMPDAYERLLMDVIRGDQTLFMRGDEVEAAWAWIDPILEAWESTGIKPRPYDSGGSGPEDALMLLHRDHRRWREIAT